MLDPQLLAINHTFQLTAAVAGLARWRRAGLTLRIVTAQIVLSLFSDAASIVMRERYHQPDNRILTSYYILAEGLLLLSAAALYFNDKRARPAFVMSALLFIGSFVYWLLYQYGELAIYAFILSNGLLIGWYFALLRVSLIREGLSLRNPYLWLCTGIIIYAGCLVPYISLTGYMNAHYRELNKKLFVIIRISANIRYLLATVCFVVIPRRHYNLSYERQ